MQATDTSDSFQQAVLERLDKLSTEVDGLKQELAQTNVRVDAYQKASNQVVNLAFGLIATATLTIIVSTVLK
jgi:sugar-specific transcriptional regulator TrmB